MRKASDRAWRETRRKALRQIATMTDEEDAEIRAGIALDPDACEITEEMWARMRPASEVVPDIVAAYRRSRGKQKAPTKQLISLRLDRDVIAHFRARGAGWQRRINAALRKAARLNPTVRAPTITKKSPRARQRPRHDR
jgi:uncharacterized protein (DUF4415 family)